MPIRNKVSTDNWFTEEKMGPGDIMFADDLEGCTVVAAVWEKSSKDGTRKAFFAHFATKTLQDATRGPRVLNKAFTEFRTATNLGNDLPDAVWLYMAAKDGGEFNEEGNNLVREQLKKAGIEKHEVTEEMYTLPARGTEKVELRPGEASLENMLVRIGVVGA